MKKILIALLIMIGFNSLSLNAQKTLTKPTKKAQATQAKPHNPSKSKAGSQNTQNTQIQSSKSLKPTGTINGHGYVDLGLSVKWATCNVGAKTPSDYGSYFAWGETTTKSEYTEANSVTYNKSMSDISSDSHYDAARAKWGGTWRLPTKAEIDELVNKCKTRWTTYNGHKGRLVTGPNGKSIFLPAAGYHFGTSLDKVGEYGYYWSSTPFESGTQYAFRLYFTRSNFLSFWNYLYYGHTVRPVSE